MTRAWIDGVAVLGPGLRDWAAARAVLRGEAAYAPAEMPQPTTDLLPSAERRRCGEIARLCLHVGVAALPPGVRAADLPTVFTSSAGNGQVLHEICEALASPQREVSPTRFHNSVHNAPAGYWAIATGAREPSTSLAALDGSFAAGLLEAALQAREAARPVLLVAYELPHPAPLAAVVPVVAPFGAALVVAPARGPASAASVDLALAAGRAETTLDEPALERLRAGNSAARALPLLRALARGAPAALALGYLPDCHLALEVAPCA